MASNQESFSTHNGKVVVISGPTASGKTRLGLWLAQKLDGEIISCDSVQVYRGLDIGSAKTPEPERQGIRHHMLDIMDPTEEYTAGDFYEDARSATVDVLSRQKVPVVVGGTGLYLRWYLYGKPDTPRATTDIVSSVQSLLSPLIQDKENGWESALELLHECGDSATGAQLARNDWYRLSRALEIIKASGKPRSEFVVPSSVPLSKQGVLLGDNAVDRDDVLCKSDGELPADLNFDFRCFFLSPPREDLYRRIDLRCEEMIDEGILREVDSLLKAGVEPNSNPASRAIGYRQSFDYLLSCREKNGLSSREEFLKYLSDFQQASRNFAKRQVVWFRSEKLYSWLDSSLPLEELGSMVLKDYNSSHSLQSARVDEEAAARERSYREAKDMKRYRTQLQIFCRVERIDVVLEWVKESQGSC